MVPRVDWMLPQFHRYIGTGSEHLDADATLHEHGDQSVSSPVLASLGWISYLLSCLDERRWNKHAGRHDLGIYNVYHYISWQFPDLSPTDCGIQ